MRVQDADGARPGQAGRPKPARPRPRLLRSTVRLRLTALYGVLFVLSGAVLLAIAGGFAVARSSVSVAGPSQFPRSPGSALSQAQSEIRNLRSQLAGTQGDAHISAFSRNLIIASLIALGLMTVVSVIMGWLVAGRALRPVREMTTAAQRISAFNLDERLAVAGPADELKELGDTIDSLLERLERAFNAQRRFVANASHELRTPLTTMRASLDVALAKPEPAPPQTVALAHRLRVELDRVDGLLEGFLILARVQHGDLPGRAALPLDYMVSAALAARRTAVEARKLTVQTDSASGGAWVVGSHALLSRMVENLVDNAIGHNADGGWIHITTESAAGRARLVVENGGARIDPAQVGELAQPFRRLGADRIGTDRGSGLGLSIVAAIAEAHGGTLSIEARRGGGLRAAIDLPAIASDPVAAPTGVPA